MKVKNRAGFTLVELAISLTIIGVLLLMIAQLVSGIIGSYDKGLTLKAVNSAARDLIEDLTTAISAAPARDIKDTCSFAYAYEDATESPYYQCQKDSAYLFVYNERYAPNVYIDGVSIDKSVPISGAFCTGQYSYIWNTGYILNKTNYSIPNEYGAAMIKYRATGVDGDNIIEYSGNDPRGFKLVRFLDQSRIACASRIDVDNDTYAKIADDINVYDLTSDIFDNNYYIASEIEEIFSLDETDLALYDLQIFHPATNNSTFRSYYTGTFVLGTLRGSINILANGNYCKTLAEQESDFNYCAINKFNFAARAIGG